MRTARLLAALAALLVLSLACGVAPEQAVDPAQPAAAAEAVAPAETEVSNDIRVVSGLAGFDDGLLTECVDSVTVVHAPDPLPDGWPDAFQPARLRSDGTPGMLEIDRLCTEQFADRVVAARCTWNDGAGTRIETVHRRFWFTGAIFEDDGPMQRCMQRGGQWYRLDANSSEGLALRSDYNFREAERLGKQLRRRR